MSLASARLAWALAALSCVAAPALGQQTKTRVETKPQAKKAQAKKADARKADAGKIDLNTADADRLQELPGIGPVYAKSIIDARPFKRVADLKKVKGMNDRLYESISPLVSVEQPEPRKAETKKAETKKAGTRKAGSRKAAAAEAKAESPAEVNRKEAALKASGKTININKATLAELQELPGIGPVKAEAIVKGRPFASAEDLMKVDGIKEGTFGRIKGFVSVK